MKIIKKLLVITLLSSILSQAQVTETPVKLEDALLWEISGNGLQKSSYLLGTMHTVGYSFLDAIPGYRKAFLTAKQIAVECDLFALDSIRTIVKQMPKSYMLMPQDTTYEMLFNRDDFCFVDSTLKKVTPKYSKFVPEFWNRIFIGKMLTGNLANLMEGMDRHLLLIGYQNNKRICFMETLEDVGRKAELKDSVGYTIMNLHYQADILLKTLRYPESTKSFLSAMEKTYREQNLNRLSIDSLCQQVGFDEPQPTFILDYQKKFGELIVDIRNEEWMANILSMIKIDSSLIAIGAMHLIGENGLICKLRKLGYVVEPVR